MPTSNKAALTFVNPLDLKLRVFRKSTGFLIIKRFWDGHHISATFLRFYVSKFLLSLELFIFQSKRLDSANSFTQFSSFNTVFCWKKTLKKTWRNFNGQHVFFALAMRLGSKSRSIRINNCQ